MAAAAVSCLLVVGALAGPLASGAGAATPAPICPAAAGNARFVRFIYLDILERCPDAAALSYWTARLDAGATRWGFTESVDMSAENVGQNNVIPIYQGLLGRPPTDAEYTAAFNEIRKYHQDAYLLARLFSTNEAYATIPGATTTAKDTEWVKQVYENVVEREASPAEISAALDSFGPGGSTYATRNKIALGRELGPENMASWTGAVIGAALHRGPNPGEFAIWFRWLHEHHRQTFRLWTRMLSSNEGYALAQTQPNPEPSDHLKAR